MRFSRSARRPPRIDISPLVDVVFQLLLFYAVTAQFVAEERLKLLLPEARTAEPQAADRPRVAEVLVTAEGRILVEGREVPEPMLEQEIRRVLGTSPERALTIRGDRTANYGAVIRVLDIARQAGARSINMAAVRPPSPPGAD